MGWIQITLLKEDSKEIRTMACEAKHLAIKAHSPHLYKDKPNNATPNIE